MSSACRLPARPGMYTSGTSESAVTPTPAADSTVASAAGPHWYRSCGKNGVASSSTRAGPALAVAGASTGPRAAHPAMASAAPMVSAARTGPGAVIPLARRRGLREFLEDVDDADGLEDQQHQEHDADDGEGIGARGHVGHLASQCPQLCIRQRSDA